MTPFGVSHTSPVEKRHRCRCLDTHQEQVDTDLGVLPHSAEFWTPGLFSLWCLITLYKPSDTLFFPKIGCHPSNRKQQDTGECPTSPQMVQRGIFLPVSFFLSKPCDTLFGATCPLMPIKTPTTVSFFLTMSHDTFFGVMFLLRPVKTPTSTASCQECDTGQPQTCCSKSFPKTQKSRAKMVTHLSTTFIF